MPFCPSALDERTLKQFVDRMLSHHREQPCPTPETWPPKRSQVQEEVARMLGFPHWHAARSMVRHEPPSLSPATAPAVGLASATSAEDSDAWATCPWSAGALTFPVFEEVLAWAGAMGVTDVIIGSRGEISLRISGGFVTHPRTVDGNDRLEIVRSLAGDVLPTKTLVLSHQVTRSRHGTCRMRVLVVAPSPRVPSDGWAIQCQPIAQIPPTWKKLGLEPYLSNRLAHAGPGLVLVAGGERAGTSQVLSAIARSRAQKRAGAPRSGADLGEHATRHLREVRRDVSGLIPTSLITRMALCSDPATCVFEHLEGEADWHDALRLAQSGHHVLAGMRVREPGVGEMLNLLFQRTPFADDRQQLIQSLSVLVAQRPVRLMNGELGMLREYLVVDAMARQELSAASVDNVAQLAERLMDVHQSSFRWAARRAFAQGKIDSVTQEVFTQSRTTC